MKAHPITLGIAFVAIGLIAGTAFADDKKEEKEPTISDTGIAEFDEVFGKARELQGAIKSQKKDLVDQRTNLNKTLGLAEDAPIETALADLKGKVAGKVQLVMDGKIPRLKPDDSLPDNVKQGVEATNKLSEKSVEVSDNCQNDLIPRSEELASKTADFPGKVPGLVKNPLDVGKKTGKVKNNVKAVGELPAKAKGLQTESQKTITEVTKVFTP